MRYFLPLPFTERDGKRNFVVHNRVKQRVKHTRRIRRRRTVTDVAHGHKRLHESFFFALVSNALDRPNVPLVTVVLFSIRQEHGVSWASDHVKQERDERYQR